MIGATTRRLAARRRFLPAAASPIFLAAAGCSDIPSPTIEHRAESWQPPPALRLECRPGVLIQVMEHVRAYVTETGGYLGCVAPGPPDRTTPPSPVLLEVEARQGVLHLANPGGAAVHVFVVAGRAVDSTRWTPCVETEQCLRVQPGTPLEIPLGAIPGWSRGEPDVVLYAWRRVMTPQGQYRPDRVRAVRMFVQSPDPTRPRY